MSPDHPPQFQNNPHLPFIMFAKLAVALFALAAAVGAAPTRRGESVDGEDLLFNQ